MREQPKKRRQVIGAEEAILAPRRHPKKETRRDGDENGESEQSDDAAVSQCLEDLIVRVRRSAVGMLEIKIGVATISLERPLITRVSDPEERVIEDHGDGEFGGGCAPGAALEIVTTR